MRNFFVLSMLLLFGHNLVLVAGDADSTNSAEEIESIKLQLREMNLVFLQVLERRDYLYEVCTQEELSSPTKPPIYDDVAILMGQLVTVAGCDEALSFLQDLEFIKKFGSTLNAASYFGQIELVKYLIKKGQDPYQENGALINAFEMERRGLNSPIIQAILLGN